MNSKNLKLLRKKWWYNIFINVKYLKYYIILDNGKKIIVIFLKVR